MTKYVFSWNCGTNREIAWTHKPLGEYTTVGLNGFTCVIYTTYWDIFDVLAIMRTPWTMRAFVDVLFRSIAYDIIWPDLARTPSMTITNKRTIVPEWTQDTFSQLTRGEEIIVNFYGVTLSMVDKINWLLYRSFRILS